MPTLKKEKKKDSWESELELAISEMIMHNQNQTEQSALFPSAYSSSVGVGCGCRPMCTSELGDEKASSLEMNYDTNQRRGGKKWSRATDWRCQRMGPHRSC